MARSGKLRTPEPSSEFVEDLLPSTVFEDKSLDEQFFKDGYVVIPFLNSEELETIEKIYHRYIEDVPGDIYFSICEKENKRKHIDHEIRKITNPKMKTLLPAFKTLLNSFVIKKAQSANFSLHRDPSFVKPDSVRALHSWCPLSDVDTSNGCMKVINNSHRLISHIGSIPLNQTPWDNCSQELEQKFTTTIKMNAGDILFFDERLLHSSHPNLTDKSRVAISSILIPEQIKPRVYFQEETAADQYTILEVEDTAFITFDFVNAFGRPFPEGVKELEKIEYKVEPIYPVEFETQKFGSKETDNNQIPKP